MKKIIIAIALLIATVSGFSQDLMPIDQYGNIFINNHLNQTYPWFEPDTVSFIKYYLLSDNTEEIDSTVETSVLFYDEVGKLISRSNYTPYLYYTQDLELISITHFSLDTFIYENNLLSKIEYYYWYYSDNYEDSVWTKSSLSMQFEYDNQQRLIKSFYINEDFSSYNTECEYQYNNNGKLDRQINNESNITHSLSYTYNSKNLLELAFESYHNNGGYEVLEHFYRHIYNYNNHNQLTSKHSQYQQIGTWISNPIADYYYYASPNDRSPIVHLNNEDTTAQYVYDTYGNCIEIILSPNYLDGFYYNNGWSFYNKMFTQISGNANKVRVHYKQIANTSQIKDIEGFASYISLFPNPATNTVELQITNDKLQIIEIEVMDMMGKLVKTTHALSPQSATINVSDLAAGTYFVRVTTSDGNVVTKKLVKQ